MGALKVWDGAEWKYASSGVVSIDPKSEMVRASAVVTLTDTTIVDIPGMTVTVNAPGADAVYHVHVSMDVAQNSTTATFVGRFEVDSVEQLGQIVLTTTTSGERMSVAQNWRVTGLSAGSHTFKMRSSLTSSGNWTVRNTHSTMLVSREV
jgi:hypothetical protein